MRKIKPFANNILVEEVKKKESASGIIVPETIEEASKPYIEGKVIAVGDGIVIDGKVIPINVKVGDKVLFTRYGIFNIDGQLLIKEENILAKL